MGRQLNRSQYRSIIRLLNLDYCMQCSRLSVVGLFQASAVEAGQSFVYLEIPINLPGDESMGRQLVRSQHRLIRLLNLD
jgi:hypothetical protein